MLFLISLLLNILLSEARLNNTQKLPLSIDHLQSLQEGGGGGCCKFGLIMDFTKTGLHVFIDFKSIFITFFE